MTTLKSLPYSLLALLIPIVLYSCDASQETGMDKFESTRVHLYEKV